MALFLLTSWTASSLSTLSWHDETNSSVHTHFISRRVIVGIFIIFPVWWKSASPCPPSLFFAKMRRSLLAAGRSRSVGDGPTQEWRSIGTTRVLSKWRGLESKIIQNLCHVGVIGNLNRRSKGSYSHEAGSRWFTPCRRCPIWPYLTSIVSVVRWNQPPQKTSQTWLNRNKS